MSKFDSMMADIHAAIDATFGDDFTLTPMLTAPSAKSIPDPARAVYVFRGIYRAPGVLQASNQRNAHESGRGVAFVGDDPAISIDDSSTLPSLPRKGDRVTGAALPRSFVVTTVLSYGKNGLRLVLAEK